MSLPKYMASERYASPRRRKQDADEPAPGRARRHVDDAPFELTPLEGIRHDVVVAAVDELRPDPIDEGQEAPARVLGRIAASQAQEPVPHRVLHVPGRRSKFSEKYRRSSVIFDATPARSCGVRVHRVYATLDNIKKRDSALNRRRSRNERH